MNSEYTCLRCNVPMIYVPLEVETYGNTSVVSHLTLSGTHIGSSTCMCPECGYIETHVSDSAKRMLSRRYGNR